MKEGGGEKKLRNQGGRGGDTQEHTSGTRRYDRMRGGRKRNGKEDGRKDDSYCQKKR